MTTRTEALASVRDTCVHWWLLAPPSGPTSKGTCRDCGATREFHNFLTDEQEKEAAWAKPPNGYQPPVEHTNAVRW